MTTTKKNRNNAENVDWFGRRKEPEVTPEQSAAGWAFVLQYAAMVDRAAWKVIRGTPIEYEDARSALALYVVENHHKWDQSRGWNARNWLHAQASKVRRSLVRAGVRNTGAPLSDDDLLPQGAPGSEARVEDRAEVALLYKRADDIERRAVLSVLQDWTAATVREHTGGSTRERDRVISRLADDRRIGT